MILHRYLPFMLFASILCIALPASAQVAQSPDLVYVYPSGPMVGRFKADEQSLDIQIASLTDEKIERRELELPRCRLIVLLGIRDLEHKDNFGNSSLLPKKNTRNCALWRAIRHLLLSNATCRL